MPDATSTWKRDLDEHGYAVIKGVVSPERAEHYTRRAVEWAERFGFKEQDRSTWTADKLPVNINGLVNDYGVSHEKWVWEARL
mgnify:CR=1 FL=1|jgi:hypothetical protein